MKRRRPIKRSTTRIKRNVRPKAVNAKRKGRRFGATGQDTARLAWVRQQTCAVNRYQMTRSPCSGPTEPDHLRSRGAGGGDATAIPLCGRHHTMRHNVGVHTFCHQWLCSDRDAVIADYQAEYAAEQGTHD